MRHDPTIKCGLAALLLVTAAHIANADKPTSQEYDAQLSGFLEIGPLATPTGAILTNGSGKLTLVVQGNMAQYSLTFSGLTTGITQSHIHFGQRHDAGGIFVFLCTNLNNGPAGTQTCPQGTSGTVTGTITSANIIAVPAQNIPAANFDVLLAALTGDTAYVNIHTTMFPGGEIRGQLEVPDKDNGKDKDNREGQ